MPYYEILVSLHNNTLTYIHPMQTGHLVYVAVSMLDANGNVAEALGFLKPWTCTAMLITEDSER